MQDTRSCIVECRDSKSCTDSINLPASSPYYSMGSSNLFNAMKYFFVLYKFFCLGLFLYQSGNCIYKYIYQETVTLSQEEPQEDHEIPNICIYSIEIYFL